MLRFNSNGEGTKAMAHIWELFSDAYKNSTCAMNSPQ